MKGLLIKDFGVLNRQMRFFLIIILIFTFIPGNMAAFAVVYAAMMPYTSLAFDERSKWDQLAAMMPYSTRDLVLSKYVLGWIFAGGTAILSLLVGLVESQFTSQAVTPSTAILSFCLGVVIMDLTLPPMFRFGVEKGRMLFILIIVIVACSTVSIIGAITEDPNLVALCTTLNWLIPVLTVVVTLISIPLSIRLYAKRNR